MADVQINLKVKLSAYTKGLIPDVSKFIEDAPNNNIIYGRYNNEWKPVDDFIHGNVVLVDEDSGLNKINISDNIIKLNIKQWIGKFKNLPMILENDITYYTFDDKPEIILSSSTAYSDENEEYMQEIFGGNASSNNFLHTLIPANSKGEY